MAKKGELSLTAEDRTNADLNAILARAHAATEGPWVTAGGNRIISPVLDQCPEFKGTLLRIGETFLGMWGVAPDVPLKNAEFIAHAREDLPNVAMELLQARQALQGFVQHFELTVNVPSRFVFYVQAKALLDKLQAEAEPETEGETN